MLFAPCIHFGKMFTLIVNPFLMLRQPNNTILIKSGKSMTLILIKALVLSIRKFFRLQFFYLCLSHTFHLTVPRKKGYKLIWHYFLLLSKCRDNIYNVYYVNGYGYIYIYSSTKCQMNAWNTLLKWKLSLIFFFCIFEMKHFIDILMVIDKENVLSLVLYSANCAHQYRS